MSKEMLNALDVLEAEKGIPKDTVIEALQAALVSAYKRHYGQASNVEVEFEPKKGNIHVYAVKEVTEEVFDSQLEVSLKDAVALNGAYEIGDKIRFEVTPKDFGRIAAQTAKQVKFYFSLQVVVKPLIHLIRVGLYTQSHSYFFI